jgi:hypothetical protein
MSLEQDLMAIEEQFWTGGPEAFQRHTDDQCLVVFKEMAGVMSKADIAKTAEKGRWKDVQPRLKGMTKLSADSIIISYECTAKRKSGEPYHALVSSGYRKRPDGWKLAFHQQTLAD